MATPYKLDLSRPVRFVASAMDRAHKETLSIAELANEYRQLAPEGDLIRVQVNENTNDPAAFSIRSALAELGEQVIVDGDAVSRQSDAVPLTWNGNVIQPFQPGQPLVVRDLTPSLKAQRKQTERVRRIFARTEKDLTDAGLSESTIGDLYELYVKENNPTNDELRYLIFSPENNKEATTPPDATPSYESTVPQPVDNGGRSRAQRGSVKETSLRYLHDSQDNSLGERAVDGWNHLVMNEGFHQSTSAGTIQQAWMAAYHAGYATRDPAPNEDRKGEPVRYRWTGGRFTEADLDRVVRDKIKIKHRKCR